MITAILITAVIAFAAGYLVGSKNPAKKELNDLRAKVADKVAPTP